ncbi:MAG: flagellar basal-body rod protein FlgF [Bosea sp. (in: a-proteobacteria)]
MENMLLIGLSRQIALGRELDVIANNVANSATNGFKARSTRFAEHVGQVARADTFQPNDKRVSFVVDKGTPIDLSTGAIERTGNGLDVAIRGDAYFEVQTRGGPRWTRDGAFEVNARGELVTQRGELVAGQNGPIRFGPNESGLRIAEDGSVFSDQGQRGKLRLASFANAKALRSEGANLFSSPTPPTQAPATITLATGSIERSNVRPVLEMSRLVEVQRAYTSIAGLIARTDELRKTAIQRLAEVPA